MLVSVIVITYNSSRYVLETLDSIDHQTYNEIELIVSDDCSKDNTLRLCQDWVAEHSGRFTRALVIQTPTNGGICHNYNYALQHAKGEWIKYIAGDDILEEICIERFVGNIRPDSFLYTCTTAHYYNETGEIAFYKTRIPDTTAWNQARFMLKYLYGINGPTIFIERNHLNQLGGFEEKYPMIEDWPIAIRFATNGWRIGIVNAPLVKWRIYGDSISHSNNAFAKSLHDAWHSYSIRYCLKYMLPLHLYHYWLDNWLIIHNKKKQHKYLGYLLRCFDLVNTKRKICPIPKEPYMAID